MSTAEPIAEDTATDLQRRMQELGAAARAAAAVLAKAPTEAKNLALGAAAAAMRDGAAAILAANATDIAAAEQRGLGAALLDRLLLTPDRIEAMAKGLQAIAELRDPVGDTMGEWQRPNGLGIARVRVPLGVIGIIYESRPNVTADAGALCLKSGNAAILRGGSESFHSSRAIHACLLAGLRAAGLPEGAVQLVPTQDRAAVGMMLTMPQHIDIIVPRGGRGLIERVQNESRIPVIAHLDGNCHVYVDGSADLEMARQISLNAKLRRTGICGASETLLVDSHCAASHLSPLVKDLLDAGCEVRGDGATQGVDQRVLAATDSDWRTEYLDSIIAVKVVDDVDAAIAHIENFGSHHTECIVADDVEVAERF
ncbi:MAG: glutamate-5-semialdehyde dehydrogenase, partial [Alphaproteobacteria bacterium]|nr:glutamate-5-semialdehyde dehydrogenase [Alphaproteobacteria bacterium]